MRREGESNQPVMDRVVKKRAWGDMTMRDHKINKMGLKQDQL